MNPHHYISTQKIINNLGIVVVLLNVLIISLICFFVGRGIWRGDNTGALQNIRTETGVSIMVKFGRADESEEPTYC